LVGYSDFPYLAQAFCIERTRTNLRGELLSSEVVYGVTSLGPERAGPKRLLSLNRNHWIIENGLHYVRDVTFDEDRCRIRKKSGARMMASLRNLAISLLRLARATNIAQALRTCMRNERRPLRLLGLAVG
jgi:hypothetical protein